MSVLVQYAIRHGILMEDSLVAVSVSGVTEVLPLRAQGRTLECKAFIKAVRAAHASGVDDILVEVTPEFFSLLSDEVVEDETQSLMNVHRLLSHLRVDVVVGDTNPSLVAVLADQPVLENHWRLSPGDQAWVDENEATVVYTDGSRSGSMVGAWAWYVDKSSFDSGPVEFVASSLTAERRALVEAIRAHEGPVLILSDCETIGSSFDAVAAAQGMDDDLAQLLDAPRVRLSHVKGHADCYGNRRADRLARAALKARLDVLRHDLILRMEHEVTAARILSQLSGRSELRQARRAWCSARRREIIAADYPDWDTLDKRARKSLGQAIYSQTLAEYAAGELIS